MYRYKIIFCFLLLLFTMEVVGQKRVQLKGKVINPATMEPIEGARITSDGARNAVLTDQQGHFTLRLDTNDKVIDVQSDGFWRREIPLHGHQEIQIYLTPLNMRGYIHSYDLPSGVQRKEDKTGSSRMYRIEDASRGALFADELLPGVFPGLMVQTKSGMPGEGNFISMRGVRTMAGSNTPLLVIDGLPYLADENMSSTYTGYSRNSLNLLLAKDLASIKLVKGFDALAYGTMGSNGVLMLETEDATDMETKIEFETVNSISMVKSQIPLLNTEEFSRYFFEMGETAYSAKDFLELYPFMENRNDQPIYNNSTDWMEEIYEPAFSTENVLKVKGSDAIAKYAMTAGYMKQKGALKNTDLSKYYVRFNTNMEVTDNVNMFVNTGFNYYEKNILEQGMVRQTNPILAAIHKPAIFHPEQKDKDGNPYGLLDPIHDFGVSNPLALVEQLAPESNGMDFMVNLGLSSWLTSTLNINASFGMFYVFNKEDLFIPGVSFGTVAPLEGGKAQNTVRNSKSRLTDYNGKISLNYIKKWGKHNFDAILQGQAIFGANRLEYAKGINTPTDFDRKLSSVGNLDGRVLTAYDDNTRWMNLFASTRYNYNNQLYLGIAASLDGSSITGENAPLVSVYPAVNAGWKINNSSFLQTFSWLDDLTFRGEYVAGGNSRLPAMIGKHYYESQYYYTLTSLVKGNIPNKDLQLEKVTTYGLGLDVATHGNRFALTLDLFEERTTDMLIEDPIDDAYGTKFRYQNSGEMSTRGLELSLNATLVSSKDFSWFLGVTFSTSQSEIESLGGRNEIITTLSDGATIISRVGENPYAFYGYKSNGVLNSTAKAQEVNLKDFKGRVFGAGDIHFSNENSENDRDDYGVIDEADRVILGDATPDFFGGFFTSFRYKQISLSAQFTYSYGNDIYNAVRRSGESMKDFTSQTEAVVNRWIYDGQSTDMPRAVYGDPMENSRFSSRWIEDGSYLKLKNLTLNYEYPRNLWVFTKFQAYITAENLLTFTKYLGEDPEFAYSNDYKYLGIDYGKVPLGQTYKVGLRFNF